MKKILYRVQRGDTLFSVCEKFGVSPLVTAEENVLDGEITEGDMLVLSEKEELYSVKPLDTFASISSKFGITEERLRKMNNVPYLFYGLTIRIK